MLLPRLRDQAFDIERLHAPVVEFANADVEFGAQLREGGQALKDFAPELLLSSFGQLGSLGKSQFECSNHERSFYQILAS